MNTALRRTRAAALLLAVALVGCQREQPADPPQPPAQAPAPAPAAEVPTPRDGASGELPEAMVLYRAADEAYADGRYDEALRKAEEAARADPGLAIAWNLVGRASAKQFEAKRDPKAAARAQEAYGRAVKVDPNFLPAWQNLAELYEQQGRHKEAAEAYARVLAIAPDHPANDRLRAFIERAGQGGG